MDVPEQRFELSKYVRFHPDGGSWSTGRAINLSKSGILFACSKLLEVGTRMELQLVEGDGRKPQVVGPPCCGEVVRNGKSAEGEFLVGVRFMMSARAAG